MRVPSTSSTLSGEAKDASNSDSSSSSSSADAVVEAEKDLVEVQEDDVTVPLRCASDGDASDSRCARPFHIHCTVTPADKIATDTDS